MRPAGPRRRYRASGAAAFLKTSNTARWFDAPWPSSMARVAESHDPGISAGEALFVAAYAPSCCGARSWRP
ncbi:hypothetical protein [Streptomyces anulatus]|uniref:hypothetical protein n=1 Tax=Streptomyces anulatus TaxID=1892 RepID=UPI0034031088